MAQCPICLNEEIVEPVIFVPCKNCEAVYCKECLETNYNVGNDTCIVCRTKVRFTRQTKIWRCGKARFAALRSRAGPAVQAQRIAPNRGELAEIASQNVDPTFLHKRQLEDDDAKSRALAEQMQRDDQLQHADQGHAAPVTVCQDIDAETELLIRELQEEEQRQIDENKRQIEADRLLAEKLGNEEQHPVVAEEVPQRPKRRRVSRVSSDEDSAPPSSAAAASSSSSSRRKRR